MQRFTELKVWRRAHAVTLDVYRLTKSFPNDDRFGLVSQLRRAAASVPTNIVEGSKREHASDYARFLNIAQGSAVEVEYLLMLSKDLGYLEADAARRLARALDDIARMLHGLRQRVQEGAVP